MILLPPQLEGGFIQIASGDEQNDILVALVKANLNATEYQAALLVIRKTWGYKKKEDWISLTQFEKYTTKSHSTVVESLNSLVRKNILVRKTIQGVRSSYQFNKDFNTWKLLVRKSGLVRKTVPTSTENRPQLVRKTVHTKDILTKEIYTKEITPQAELVVHFSNLFNKRFKKPYMPFKTDYMNMAALIKIYSIDKLKTYIEWYMHWDSWQTKYGFNIGNFFKNINSITSSASPFNY